MEPHGDLVNYVFYVPLWLNELFRICYSNF